MTVRAVERVVDGLRLSLIGEPEVTAGENTVLRLAIEPSDTYRVEFVTGGRFTPFDFFVRRKGEKVWNYFGGKFAKAAAIWSNSTSVQQPLTCQVVWPVVDIEGVPCLPGITKCMPNLTRSSMPRVLMPRRELHFGVSRDHRSAARRVNDPSHGARRLSASPVCVVVPTFSGMCDQVVDVFG